MLDKDGNLEIIQTANQDTPLELGKMPILNIDVWEHAYYLKNFNVRKSYTDNWFEVVNWEQAQERYHGRAENKE